MKRVNQKTHSEKIGIQPRNFIIRPLLLRQPASHPAIQRSSQKGKHRPEIRSRAARCGAVLSRENNYLSFFFFIGYPSDHPASLFCLF